MTDDILNRIRNEINAEIAELRENSERHSDDVQITAILIAEGLLRALRIIEDISLKDGEQHD